MELNAEKADVLPWKWGLHNLEHYSGTINSHSHRKHVAPFNLKSMKVFLQA